MSEKPRDPNEPQDEAIEIDDGGVDSEDSKSTSGAGPTQAEYDKLKNDFLYLGAEFENYKRHAIKERSDLARYGAERLARDLLEVVDNFERAMAVEASPESFQTLRSGIEMVHREMQSLLSRHGIREDDPVGKPFDPSLHEALTSEETSQYPPGSVSRVFKKAYRLHDRLLRPAQVVVAKAPSESQS